MENKEQVLNTAKRIIAEEIEKAGYKTEVIYLFGSRARGDYKEYSDWDFFVVIDKSIDFTAKKHIRGRIGIRLAELHISSDIIIQSADIANERKHKFGYLTYYALKEGLAV
ncbi:MAG: nucleotidyltransferase family protein [bacterium]